MHHFLEMTDQGQHRQDGLDQHAVVPFTAPAQTQVRRLPTLLAEVDIGKDDHLGGHAIDNVLEGRAVVDIGGVTIQVDDQPQVIQQQTQLAADDPTPIGTALATDLAPGCVLHDADESVQCRSCR